MQVFKFGGASVKDAEAIKNVGQIVQANVDQQLVIIVSAIGKTTNALEQVLEAHAQKSGEAFKLLEEVKTSHYKICHDLFGEQHTIYAQLNDIFVEVEWVIEEEPDEPYDFMYDQIVSIGELASSRILAAYIEEIKIPVAWLDARGLIRTDELYREAWVDWKHTTEQIKKQVWPVLEAGKIAISQGFIGSTSDNYTTTLGREGSDYTAAIFSFCLDAASMTIWKDVPGVLTADPRYFEHVIKLDRLSYREAIEMTYYGAKVIHPKTIKPLQNKSIPLLVKSFVEPDGSGTYISSEVQDNYPPMTAIERDQAMLNISTRDFSFVAEHHLSYLFQEIAKHRIQVNLMQNTAISFFICVNDIDDRIDQFVKAINEGFSVTVDRGLELITVRHYNKGTVRALQEDRMVLLEERIAQNMQMVTKEITPIRRKVQ